MPFSIMSWSLIPGLLGLLCVLRVVDASGNCSSNGCLATVSDCPKNCSCSGSKLVDFRVECSKMGFITIPQGLPTYTWSLDLSQNDITTLGANLMDSLSRLDHLNLSSNNMRYVDENAFQGLISLKELYLQSNILDISDKSNKLPPITFQPISSLEVLDIRHNIPLTLGYPEKMWIFLLNLKELYMDGADDTFGDGFLPLHKLQTLSFSGSRSGSFNSTTFKGLRQSPLQELNLENCNIGDFDGQAFQYITAVKKLLMSNNPLLGKNILHVGSGFKLMPTLEYLDLNRTKLGDYINPLISDYLCNSNLKRLTVSNNSIEDLSATMSECLPQLEVFSLTFNSFSGRPNEVGNMLKLQRIRLLNLSSQGSQKNIIPIEHENALPLESDIPPPVSFPSTLEFLDVSHNGITLHDINSVKLVTPVNLQLLRAVNTGITNIKGPIDCAYKPEVQELDISDNTIKHFNETVFTKCNWSALRKLKMGGNSLSNSLADQKDRPFFKPLSGLRELDLSSNGLVTLHVGIFSNNTDLRILQLSHNLIDNFTASISQLKHLQLLDLSDNRIPGLTMKTVAEIQLLFSSSPELKVDLSYNEFRCICEYLHAIEWIAKHQDNFKNLHLWKCKFNDGTVKTFDHLGLILQKLEGECQTFGWFYGSFAGSLAAMVLMAAGAVVFRWRFTLQVSWYKPRSVEDEVEYEFDSFVVYNNQDRNWVQTELCRNLEINNASGIENLPASREMDCYKLCCHHRDFMIGMHIIDNITDAFDKSRTTLIAMSNASLCGNWWQLELQMAVQTAVARRTNSLLFVFLEPLEGRLVTPQLRRILKTFTCKRWYPDDYQKQQELWRDLKIAMKFPKQNGLTRERQP